METSSSPEVLCNESRKRKGSLFRAIHQVGSGANHDGTRRRASNRTSHTRSPRIESPSAIHVHSDRKRWDVGKWALAHDAINLCEQGCQTPFVGDLLRGRGGDRSHQPPHAGRQLLSSSILCTPSGSASTTFVQGQETMAVGKRLDHDTGAIGQNAHSLKVILSYFVE
jgi:hypothetical protein